MNAPAAIANAAWFASCLPEYLGYRRASRRPEAAQQNLLSQYLRRNAATRFGREHSFEKIRDYDDWVGAVPVRRYEDYGDWIARIASGEQNVLTVDNVRLFEPSSGSSGAEKWIPYTDSLQRELRRAVAAWICGLFLGDPALGGGRAYWSLTPPAPRPERPASAVPIGFDDDTAYLGGIAQRLLGRALVSLPDLAGIEDEDDFWRMTARTLLDCPDLRLISAWHPSFVLLLREKVREQTGTDTLPWPGLRLISCWGDAQAASVLPDLQAAFPGITIQPKGLLATEGAITIPFGGNRPLAIRSHFFEFEDETGTVSPSWVLQDGAEYAVILTTGGGLYRYALRDRVRVTGFYRTTPCLEFLGKADNVSDLRGEKISEDFVGACLASVLDNAGVRPLFAMLAPDGDKPRYCLFIESRDPLPAELSDHLDRSLRSGYHYNLCRELGQLQPVRVLRTEGNAYRTYTRALVSDGMRLGDIKPTPLNRRRDWPQLFAANR